MASTSAALPPSTQEQELSAILQQLDYVRALLPSTCRSLATPDANPKVARQAFQSIKDLRERINNAQGPSMPIGPAFPVEAAQR
jgi:hypothetical protein